MNAPLRHPTAARTETLTSVVQSIYDRGLEPSAAAEMLAAELKRRTSLHDDLFFKMATQLLDDLRRSDNARIRSGQTVPPQPFHDYRPANDGPAPVFKEQSVASKAAGNAAFRATMQQLEGLFLLTFKYDGKEYVLGRSTPEELKPVAAHYIAQGSNMLRQGRWLECVIASARSGVAVAKSLSLKEVQRMKTEIDQLPV